ncbi:hypothetical protein AQUCO_03500136v1, partial [Aquilegia coerulea]
IEVHSPTQEAVNSIASSHTSDEFSSLKNKRQGTSSVKNRVNSNGYSLKSYTDEESSLIRQIKKQKGYYGILGLKRNCSIEDVRKSYMNLSLKVHPDKNKAPGAEEAFKAVSKAFQCLGNEENKKIYDLVGLEEDDVVHKRRGARKGSKDFNVFNYEDDFDANQIFRTFFFGAGDHRSSKFNVCSLIQLIPFFLVIVSNFWPSSQPVYSLNRSHLYEHQFSTQRGVNYYVKTTKFEQEYPPNSPDRVALEEQINQNYNSLLKQNCRFESRRYDQGLIHETPHCDRFKQCDRLT